MGEFTIPAFVVDVLQKVRHVLGVHGAGLLGHARRQVRMPDDGDTVPWPNHASHCQHFL